MTESDDSPPRNADLPAGYDEEDPYDGTDIRELPDWWRENVEHFESYGMRPYRPPRFADGTITTEVIDDLEATHGVEIEFRAVDPSTDSDWEIRVDGDAIATIGRERTGEGFTQYKKTTAEVRSLIQSAIDDGS